MVYFAAIGASQRLLYQLEMEASGAVMGKILVTDRVGEKLDPITVPKDMDAVQNNAHNSCISTASATNLFAG